MLAQGAIQSREIVNDILASVEVEFLRHPIGRIAPHYPCAGTAGERGSWSLQIGALALAVPAFPVKSDVLVGAVIARPLSYLKVG